MPFPHASCAARSVLHGSNECLTTVILIVSAWKIAWEVEVGPNAGHAVAYSSLARLEIASEGRDQTVKITVVRH